jgi:hypothetical protein
MGASEVRRAAARIQEIGDDVRRLADQVLCARAAGWRSTAAALFRQRLAEEAARVRAAAGHVDDAAEALRRHAIAVDELERQLGGAGRIIGIGGER